MCAPVLVSVLSALMTISISMGFVGLVSYSVINAVLLLLIVRAAG